MGEGLVEEGAGGSRMIHEWRRVNDGGRRWERGEVGFTGLQKTEGWKELKGSGISIYVSIYIYIYISIYPRSNRIVCTVRREHSFETRSGELLFLTMKFSETEGSY